MKCLATYSISSPSNHNLYTFLPSGLKESYINKDHREMGRKHLLFCKDGKKLQNTSTYGILVCMEYYHVLLFRISVPIRILSINRDLCQLVIYFQSSKTEGSCNVRAYTEEELYCKALSRSTKKLTMIMIYIN